MGKGILGLSSIIDGLGSTATGKALSAAQGKALRDIQKYIEQTLPKEGLEIQYNSTSALDVRPGICVDDTGTEWIQLPALRTKNALAQFSGTQGGGGQEAGMTTNAGDSLHVFVIKNISTGDVDVMFSNTINPVLPLGFNVKRRVGSVIFGATNTIRDFFIMGNSVFYRDLEVDIVLGPLPNNSNVTITLPVPNQIDILVDMIVFYSQGGSGSVGTYYPFNTNHVKEQPTDDFSLPLTAPLGYDRSGTVPNTQKLVPVSDGKIYVYDWNNNVSGTNTTNMKFTVNGYTDIT